MALSLSEIDTIKNEVSQVPLGELSIFKNKYYKMAQQISLDINSSIDLYNKIPKDLLKELEILNEKKKGFAKKYISK